MDRKIFIALLFFLAAVALPGVHAANVSSCQDLTAANTVYTMDQNITINGSTCIQIQAENVTLDCAGYSITGNNISSTYGVNSNKANVLITNCQIYDFGSGTNGACIYLPDPAHGSIVQNTITNCSSYGIQATGYNLIIRNSSGISKSAYGIYFDAGSIASNNSIINSSGSSQSFDGISLSRNTRSFIINSTGSTSSSRAGITISGNYWTGYNTIVNSVGTSSGSGDGISIGNEINDSVVNSTGAAISGKGIYIGGDARNNLISISIGNSTSGVGVYVQHNNNTNLVNTTGISNSNFGIFLDTTIGAIITNSSGFSNSSHGIKLSANVNTNISNSLGNSTTGYGIYLTSSSNKTIINRSTGASTSSTGILLDSLSQNNSIIGSAGSSISGYGIQLSSSNNTLVNDFGLSNSSAGIYLNSASRNFINSTLANSTSSSAILLIQSTTNTLINNTINSGTGIGLDIQTNSNNNTFLRNNISGSIWVKDTSAENTYNDTTRGNIYYFTNGTGAWETYNITDTNGDSYADEGTALPFNKSTVTTNWTNNGQDWHPYTLNRLFLIANSFTVNNSYARNNTAITFTAEVLSSHNLTQIYAFKEGDVSSNLTSAGDNLYTLTTTPASLGCVSDGACTLNLSLSNAANLSSNDTSLNITVDNTIPSLSQPTTNVSIAKSSEQINLRATATDNNLTSVVAYASTVVSLTLATGNTYEANTTYAALGCSSNSACTIHFNATDAAGNVNSSVILAVIVDDAPPFLVLNNPVNGANSSTASITFNFTASDSLSTANSSLYINGTYNQSVYGNVTYQFNFTLADGNYSWYVSAADNATNTNASAAYNFTVDTVTPSITASTTSTTTSSFTASVTSNESVSFTLFYGTDFSSSVGGANLSNASTITVSALSSSTAYTYRVRGCDAAGNCANSSNVSVTTSAVTTSPGGGGGGGGGGTVSTAKNETKFFPKINTSVAANFTSSGPLKEIDISVSSTMANVSITVTKLNSTTVPAPNGTIYQYLQIDHNLNIQYLQSAAITFNVSNSWLSNNSYSVNEVTMQRYLFNAWQNLPTTFVSRSSTETEFNAVTPGFSVFAITAQHAAAAPPPAQQTQPPVQPTQENQTQQNTQNQQQTTASTSPAPAQYNDTFVAIGSVALIIVIGYFYYRRRKKKKRVQDVFGLFKSNQPPSQQGSS